MSDLVEFLTARLDAVEMAAIGARGSEFCMDGKWVARGPFGKCDAFGSVQSEARESILGEGDDVPFLIAAHIALHDPNRVLREVEAKRRMVDELAAIVEGASLPEEVHDGRDVNEVETDEVVAAVAQQMLRLLALPYDSHPDYREEWRP